MIESLVDTMLGKLKEIARSETVIGQPVQAGEVVVIPVSKISLGFGAAGGDRATGEKQKNGQGSGTGGGAVIEPVAVITLFQGEVKLHVLKEKGVSLGKIVESIPAVLNKFSKGKKKSAERAKPEK
jgi:uncharacterized spore protein YtfJ